MVSSEPNAAFWKAFAFKNVLFYDRNIPIKESYRDGIGQHRFLFRIVLKKRYQMIRGAFVQPRFIRSGLETQRNRFVSG